AHHCDGRRERINSLRRIKCIYSDDTMYPGFWFVVNTDSRFARLPAKTGTPDSDVDPTQPQWIDDSHPQLGFTPSFGGNEGSIISIIRVPDAAIPFLLVILPNGKYKLDPQIAAQWANLERDLVAIADILEEDISHLPNIHRPRLPGSFSYAGFFSSHLLAIETLSSARDAFSDLTTHLSFLLSLWRFSNLRYPFSNLLRWVKRKAPASFVTLGELVRSSNLGDFRIGTRAGYLRARTLRPDPIESSISDWVPKDENFILAYQKYKAQLAQGKADSNRWNFASYRSFVAKMSDVLPPSELFTRLGTDSGCLIFQQLALFGFRDGDYSPGMAPADYFAIRKEAVQRWLDMDEDHRPSACNVFSWDPSFASASVFVWELERGVWSRRMVDPLLNRAFFEIHKSTQRWWDPIHGDIELCTGFQASTFDPNLCVFKKIPVNFATHGTGWAPPNAPPPPVHLYSSDSQHSEHQRHPRSEHFCPPTARDVWFEARSLPSLITIATDRLGYSPARNDAAPVAMQDSIRSPAPEQCLAALGVLPGKLAALSNAERVAIADIANTLLCVGKPLANVRRDYGLPQLPSHWDISPLAPSSCAVGLPGELASHRFWFKDNWGTVLSRFVVGLSSKHLTKQYWVLIVDATTLLQICRAGLKERRSIARYLIQQGIPFHLAILAQLTNPPTPRNVARQGLGFFSDDEPWTRYDYDAYEQKMTAFLKSRRGALALRYGGVVWRLAIEAVTPRQVQYALEAPTRAALAGGQVCGVCFDNDLLSDDLEPHELDLILGAHRYRSRNPKVIGKLNPNSIAMVWPPLSAWSKSSWNTGEWSQTAEVWFQQRRAELRRGEPGARPLSTKDWKSKLRHMTARDTRAVWKGYEALAVETYLSS
ncbi:hypothetical protein FA13DRAFT_1628504, partial [Coprinellus micaceus]